uniref:DDB_G0284557 protein n=1 Tax=Fopius arisanus TaxID=64838 RepID=A0A0C9R799_9HYME
MKLMEVSRPVELPLPQRKYANTILGKKMQGLRLERNIQVVDYHEANSRSLQEISSAITEKNKLVECQLNKRLNVTNGNQISEQIGCNNCEEKIHKYEQNKKKRRNNLPLPADSKKRQKITWP